MFIRLFSSNALSTLCFILLIYLVIDKYIQTQNQIAYYKSLTKNPEVRQGFDPYDDANAPPVGGLFNAIEAAIPESWQEGLSSSLEKSGCLSGLASRSFLRFFLALSRWFFVSSC